MVGERTDAALDRDLFQLTASLFFMWRLLDLLGIPQPFTHILCLGPSIFTSQKTSSASMPPEISRSLFCVLKDRPRLSSRGLLTLLKLATGRHGAPSGSGSCAASLPHPRPAGCHARRPRLGAPKS